MMLQAFLKNMKRMSKEQTRDLLKFLKPFSPGKTEVFLWLRDFVWDQFPQANELIYDNYNALVIGWSPTEKASHTFCSVALFRTNENIHFGFYWGSMLSDPDKLLLGEGKQYRYYLVKDFVQFPEAYISALVKDAYDISLDKVEDKDLIRTGLTITKSMSEKKREKPGKESTKSSRK